MTIGMPPIIVSVTKEFSVAFLYFKFAKLIRIIFPPIFGKFILVL